MSAPIDRVRAWLRGTVRGDFARVVGVHDAVLTDDLAALLADRDALAAQLEGLRVAAARVRVAQASAAAAKARYEATWGTVDGAPISTDAEKITAALTAWHVAGDALGEALDALLRGAP